MSTLRQAVAAVRRDSRQRTVICPAHDDAHASLSVGLGDRGIVLKCHAGCRIEAVLDATGMQYSDLFLNPVRDTRALLTSYPYHDETGQLLFEVLRYIPKAFSVRRADGTHGIKGVRRVLFGLPLLHDADTVFVVEGEADALAVRALGLHGTTNPFGAGKWRDDFSRQLIAARVRRVIAVPDNDLPGKRHAEQVARSCAAGGLNVAIVELPGLPQGGDVRDWLSAHTRDELLGLTSAAQSFTGDGHAVHHTAEETVVLKGGRRISVASVLLALDLEARGVTLRVDDHDGALVVQPRSLLSESDEAAIRARSRELVEIALYEAPAL